MINRRTIFQFVFLLYLTFSIGQTKTKSTETNAVKNAVPSPQNGNDDTIYTTASVEVKPSFPNGVNEMYVFIGKNIVIPQEVIDKKERQSVFVSFIVEKDGRLTDIKVLRDTGFGTDKEVIRVLNLMPKWLPGEHNGHPVRCSYSFPIRLNGRQ